MFAQVLCPVQSAFLSDVCSSFVIFFFPLNYYNLNLEDDVFSYVKRTGAPTEKTRELKKNLRFLKDLNSVQHSKLPEDKDYVISAVGLIFSSLSSTEESFSQYLWE